MEGMGSMDGWMDVLTDGLDRYTGYVQWMG
jgi:hypothetical protein